MSSKAKFSFLTNFVWAKFSKWLKLYISRKWQETRTHVNFRKKIIFHNLKVFSLNFKPFLLHLLHQIFGFLSWLEFPTSSGSGSVLGQFYIDKSERTSKVFTFKFFQNNLFKLTQPKCTNTYNNWFGHWVLTLILDFATFFS